MIQPWYKQKNIIVYILIAFAGSWVLFLLPILFGQPGDTTRQTVSLILWSIAMWGPGLAAILTNRLVDRQSIGALNLHRLGEWRPYLWAWLLPFFLTIAAGLLTWLLGIGKLDLEFTQIREAMEQASGPQLPPLMIIGLQAATALTIGPLFNTLFAMGEELGWRGYLLVKLLPYGQWRAMLISGAIWGIWHAPVILQGHNYPNHPILGVFLMTVFCVLFGIILSWLYLRTRSPWVAALGHGSLNAVAGLPILFMPKVDLAFGGPLTSIIGWVPMIVFVGWLIWSSRLPVAADHPPLGEQNAEISLDEDAAA